ncbi:hypothetical protein A2U01_0035362, partial [Trifolium medium]|nr:hypothetical protein [Trifolium medium]
MEHLEHNQKVLSEDVDAMKGKLDQLFELMQALTRKENDPPSAENNGNVPVEGSSSLPSPMPVIIPVKNSQGSLTIQNGQTSNQTVPVNAHSDVKSAQMYQALEERLKVVEGFIAYGVDALDMCLVPDVVIPLKFKVP